MHISLFSPPFCHLKLNLRRCVCVISPHFSSPPLYCLSLLQCCEVALSLEPRLHPPGVSKDAVGYLAEHHSLRMDHANPTTRGLGGD